MLVPLVVRLIALTTLVKRIVRRMIGSYLWWYEEFVRAKTSRYYHCGKDELQGPPLPSVVIRIALTHWRY